MSIHLQYWLSLRLLLHRWHLAVGLLHCSIGLDRLVVMQHCNGYWLWLVANLLGTTQPTLKQRLWGNQSSRAGHWAVGTETSKQAATHHTWTLDRAKANWPFGPSTVRPIATPCKCDSRERTNRRVKTGQVFRRDWGKDFPIGQWSFSKCHTAISSGVHTAQSSSHLVCHVTCGVYLMVMADANRPKTNEQIQEKSEKRIREQRAKGSCRCHLQSPKCNANMQSHV